MCAGAGVVLLFTAVVLCCAVYQATRARLGVEELRRRVSELQSEVRALREELGAEVARFRRLEQQLGPVKQEINKRFERDSRGETPDVVMRRYLEAHRRKEWAKAFACLGSVPDEIDLELYVWEMERADDELLGYGVEGYELVDSEHAVVYVTHKFRYRSTGQVLAFEREPWSCVKENGVWEVRWLPRQ